ncbi:MAG: VRR-NUC domain-containing protein [Cyclobacteriaceae bacterium]
MAEKEPVILPAKYYLDYFKFLLDFVSEKSGKLLGEPGEKFIEDFGLLSEDAQCLLIRMTNRKGDFFRMSKLSYDEISNIGAATEELIEAGFSTIDPVPDPVIFKLFTKPELTHIFPEREFKPKKKDEILLQLMEEAKLSDYQKIHSTETVIQLLRQEEIEFVKLLFFGHNHGQMTEFVIRDIGNIKLENLDNHAFTPWFDSHEEALAVFELSKLNRAIKDFISLGHPEDLLEAISPINWSSLINYPNARKQSDRIMLRLGEYFEKVRFYDEALSYYALAKKHPCRERQIRIFQKLDRTEDAIDLAEYILEQPYNASEHIFAKDFLSKTSLRNYRSTTARIKLSESITVPTDASVRVEQQALEYFAAQGYDGIHSENFLWRAIFGLLFWEELFHSDNTTFHNPLQRAPSDLYSRDFYEKRKEALQAQIKTYNTKNKLLNKLTTTYSEKVNINNPLVGWHESLLPSAEHCVKHLPLNGLKHIMLEIAKNVKDNSTGFPDLFIWNEKSYHFYEIKSPNDHLSSQQLFWLDFFKQNKIKSEILRVNYD